MTQFSLAEAFVSINGEGTRAGELAVFLRFCGCNLTCSFCDTTWANQPDVPSKQVTAEELVAYVQKTGVRNVTLTGGEPLLQSGIEVLITELCALGYQVEIETNGSVSLAPFASLQFRPFFTMDYKLPGSRMENSMLTENFALLQALDTVKFVVGSQADLERAAAVIREYSLDSRCHVYLSPVFGAIDPADIVEFMKEKNMNGVRLQLQLHKYIWDPQKRGV